MKRVLIMLILISGSMATIANENHITSGKDKSLTRDHQKPLKTVPKRVCEASYSGSISTYLTKITFTCTSTASTCDQAKKSAKTCVENLIVDAFTKVSATIS